MDQTRAARARSAPREAPRGSRTSARSARLIQRVGTYSKHARVCLVKLKCHFGFKLQLLSEVLKLKFISCISCTIILIIITKRTRRWQRELPLSLDAECR